MNDSTDSILLSFSAGPRGVVENMCVKSVRDIPDTYRKVFEFDKVINAVKLMPNSNLSKLNLGDNIIYETLTTWYSNRLVAMRHPDGWMFLLKEDGSYYFEEPEVMSQDIRKKCESIRTLLSSDFKWNKTRVKPVGIAATKVTDTSITIYNRIVYAIEVDGVMKLHTSTGLIDIDVVDYEDVLYASEELGSVYNCISYAGNLLRDIITEKDEKTIPELIVLFSGKVIINRRK